MNWLLAGILFAAGVLAFVLALRPLAFVIVLILAPILLAATVNLDIAFDYLQREQSVPGGRVN